MKTSTIVVFSTHDEHEQSHKRKTFPRFFPFILLYRVWRSVKFLGVEIYEVNKHKSLKHFVMNPELLLYLEHSDKADVVYDQIERQ